MSSGDGILSRILRLLVGGQRSGRISGRRAAPRSSPPADEFTPGRDGGTATHEIAPPAGNDLTIGYAPKIDGAPDAGEIVWTWVPFEENDGRGKDRPVLVIGRLDQEHVYAVKLTSKDHDGDREFLSIGSGSWDSAGRPSWVDVDQFYLVHRYGLRREAAALDRERFEKVAAVLHRRYGWAVAD
ncbi:type II toxin-antitoxin system PemK/MazF family toxin [Microbacterium kribbense]|uniref:Type II toxin-antitoxin system PemK/MazF family toxin n=1 Tax=Microbacterium kribbense TaxID=433645 RepID=A0ABP7GR57_9MICO